MGPVQRQARLSGTSPAQSNTFDRVMRRDQSSGGRAGLSLATGAVVGLRQREADLNQRGESGHQRNLFVRLRD